MSFVIALPQYFPASKTGNFEALFRLVDAIFEVVALAAHQLVTGMTNFPYYFQVSFYVAFEKCLEVTVLTVKSLLLSQVNYVLVIREQMFEWKIFQTRKALELPSRSMLTKNMIRHRYVAFLDFPAKIADKRPSMI